MTWINDIKHTLNKKCAGLAACALVLALAGAPVLAPAQALADVRKADVVYGQTVDARGLSVAQCPSIDAEYAFVMDKDGTVYFERNATSPTQIASITKIMTAVVALDAVASGAATLDSTVAVSAAAAAVGESSADLQEGDTMPLEVALKALLVPSGNDAAVAIAETIGGSEDAFVAAMNAKAAELGCIDTVFENPHGLDDGEFAGDQHSCAADVAKMSQYAMKNETFRAIVGGGDTAIVVNRADGTKPTIELESTDELIDYYSNAIGIKTGFTALAGPSFAGAANNGDKELYAVVIHSTSEAQRFEDARELFDWVYEHELDYRLANSAQTATMTVNGARTEVPVAAEVPHTEWIDKTVKATLADPEASVRIFDLNGNVSQSLEFDEVTGDVKAGDKVGTVTFKQRNATIATVDLVACEDVAAPDLLEGIGIWWDRLFRGLSGQPQVASAVTLNETPLVVDKTAVAA
ncbi:D-alanyl-D-alanine carboxypeptidase family protein [Gordonibacter massiliensis (ex Traore et al. 2017)]|uniref:D-alanyl-D-alanine carboxypeptidase family protein n=1 Tax=Gordonibacter massiliensis (ex Traore et al. 2017) TaxID=1841863 RepID=UPI001C8B6EF0|nr:D-alanyl-D-alanine carboxypeptidase family protein [Gordonibacter massiliensis (ex Traore et al. 2017)]MBX9033095.1 D-alanyl-D-alanine carboxypeptidase [Gordonibacter massiliensis (ex Traore et al. 2017)]